MNSLSTVFVWSVFGIFAILQATRVSKIKNRIVLLILFFLGPFGFLYCYFFGPHPTETEDLSKTHPDESRQLELRISEETQPEFSQSKPSKSEQSFPNKDKAATQSNRIWKDGRFITIQDEHDNSDKE